jgi:sarcosine oxidase subunit alpha
VQLAIREGFGAVEHVKRYTTAGMGIDQGKTGNLNVVGAIANATGATPVEIGTTTFRSPYVPVEFGVITGIREESVYLPYRHTPLTAWHQARGACIYEAGARWRRPGYYPLPGESFQQTVNRESLAVREGVGVYDGAPLGKFEIKGRDAARFLDLLYTNRFDNLQTGRGRYGIMLSDDGMIMDDGVSFKLAEHHYFMSTSTGNADRINQHMEFFLQTHRPEWQVHITTVTTQWANATLCGPRARELAQLLAPRADLSNEALPFMAMLETEVAGIPARVCRVSFTGELSFEINVWPRHFATLWERIMAAGETFGITPIGSEANHVLRVEKGFLSLGHEVDGTADPYDLGLGWIMSDKPDYLGKRAVQIRRAGGEPRRELVGLLVEDPARLVEESAPITPEGRREASEGFVSACVWSVVQKRSIALALLLDGRRRIGETVYIRMQDEVVRAEVTRPCFHDPDGKRLRG